MSNTTQAVRQEFESGNFNISLIASRLDLHRVYLFRFIKRTEELRDMYEAHRLVVMDERERKHRDIALYAMERGVGAAAYKYKAPKSYILSCIHKQKDSSDIARAAKASDKTSGFYQVGFYY